MASNDVAEAQEPDTTVLSTESLDAAVAAAIAAFDAAADLDGLAEAPRRPVSAGEQDSIAATS